MTPSRDSEPGEDRRDRDGTGFDALQVAANSPHPVPFDIPDLLDASVRRHQDNMLRLVLSCQRAGIDEHEIETSIRTLVESFRQELVAAIGALAQPAQAAGEH
jgi:hypothetical protein